MVFYIDPQSYNNLSVYDFNLLTHVGAQVVYFHNTKYQLATKPVSDSRAVFNYSDKRGLLKACSYARSMWRIALAARRERPEVVHIQWFRLWLVDALFVKFLRALGVKIVHTAHNILPHNPSKNDVWQYKWYYKNSHAIIVHTQRTADEMAVFCGFTPQQAASKIHIIPHGLL